MGMDALDAAMQKAFQPALNDSKYPQSGASYLKRVVCITTDADGRRKLSAYAIMPGRISVSTCRYSSFRCANETDFRCESTERHGAVTRKRPGGMGDRRNRKLVSGRFGCYGSTGIDLTFGL